jgi:hypothetical protein
MNKRVVPPSFAAKYKQPQQFNGFNRAQPTKTFGSQFRRAGQDKKIAPVRSNHRLSEAFS